MASRRSKKKKRAPKSRRPRRGPGPSPAPAVTAIERTLESALEALSTDNQRAFVREYPIDLNATKAAVRAGYSEKGASQQGSELLANPKVQEAISIAKALRAERTQIKADRVLEELAKIGFAQMRSIATWGPDGVDVVDSRDLSDADAASVSEVTERKTEFGTSIKVKLHDKKPALDLLGRHLGLWDKESGPGGNTFNFNNLADGDLKTAILKLLTKAGYGSGSSQ